MDKNNLNILEEQKNQNRTDQNDPGTSTGEEITKRKKPARGFNNIVGEAELLAEAMSSNKELLASGGGGEEFINKLKDAVNELKNLNQQQEKYKASQREATGIINQKLKEMGHLVRKGRRIVKNEIEQKRWVEFGITATR